MKVLRTFAMIAAAGATFAGIPMIPGGMSLATAQEATAFVPFEGAVPASTVTSAQIGQTVTIEGSVVDFIESRAERTPHQMVLAKNGEQSVMVIYWQDLSAALHGDKGAPKPGTRVSAKGQLSDYRGNIQLRVRTADQIRIEGYAAVASGAPAAPAPRPPAAPAAEAVPKPGEDGYFTAADLPRMGPLKGGMLSLRGQTTGFRASWSETAPNVIEVAEGPNKIEVVYWTTPGETAPDFSKPGTPIYATGTFQEYRERLQLKVDELASLSATPLAAERVVRPAAPGTPGTNAAEGWPGKTVSAGLPEAVKLEEGATLPIRSIGSQHAGNTIKLEGAVHRTEKTAAGLAIYLRDGQATIRVNAPAEAPAPADGTRLSATGKLTFSGLRSATELDVTDAASLEVVAPTP